MKHASNIHTHQNLTQHQSILKKLAFTPFSWAQKVSSWIHDQTAKTDTLTRPKCIIWLASSLALPHRALILKVTMWNQAIPCHFCYHRVKTSTKHTIDQKQIPIAPWCPKWSVHIAHFGNFWHITHFPHFFHSKPPIPKPSYTHSYMPNTIPNYLLWSNKSNPKPTKNHAKIHQKLGHDL